MLHRPSHDHTLLHRTVSELELGLRAGGNRRRHRHLRDQFNHNIRDPQTESPGSVGTKLPFFLHTRVRAVLHTLTQRASLEPQRGPLLKVVTDSPQCEQRPHLTAEGNLFDAIIMNAGALSYAETYTGRVYFPMGSSGLIVGFPTNRMRAKASERKTSSRGWPLRGTTARC